MFDIVNIGITYCFDGVFDKKTFLNKLIELQNSTTSKIILKLFNSLNSLNKEGSYQIFKKIFALIQLSRSNGKNQEIKIESKKMRF